MLCHNIFIITETKKYKLKNIENNKNLNNGDPILREARANI